MRNSVFQNFFRTWQRHIALQSATVLVLSMSFVLISFFAATSKNLYTLLSSWGENLQMTVYLSEGTDSKRTDEIQKILESEDKLESVLFVPKSKALEVFKTQVSSYAPDLVADPEILDLVPSSFHVSMAKSLQMQAGISAFSDLAEKIKTVAGVSEVTYGQDWLEKYVGFIRAVHVFGAFVITVLLSAVLFVMGNSIRNAVSQRREEIEILELIGASAGMIRRPFVVQGAFVGGLSAVIGVGLSFAIYKMILESLIKMPYFVNVATSIEFLGFFGVSSILMLGVLSGALGSYLCVRKINSGWAASKRSQR